MVALSSTIARMIHTLLVKICSGSICGHANHRPVVTAEFPTVVKSRLLALLAERSTGARAGLLRYSLLEASSGGHSHRRPGERNVIVSFSVQQLVGGKYWA